MIPLWRHIIPEWCGLLSWLMTNEWTKAVCQRFGYVDFMIWALQEDVKYLTFIFILQNTQRHWPCSRSPTLQSHTKSYIFNHWLICVKAAVLQAVWNTAFCVSMTIRSNQVQCNNVASKPIENMIIRNTRVKLPPRHWPKASFRLFPLMVKVGIGGEEADPRTVPTGSTSSYCLVHGGKW